jgi:hypothetical protein
LILIQPSDTKESPIKAKSAFANLLLRDVPSAGVVAASRGKHGAAVIYAAQQFFQGGTRKRILA